MSTIAKRIEDKMNALESSMNTQEHIDDPDKTGITIEILSMYRSHMSDADKDFVGCCC